MKRPVIVATLAALAIAAPVSAFAHVEVSVGLGFPTYGYYSPPPPVAYVPAPRYYQPPPTVYYGQPQVIYQSNPYWGQDWRDDDEHDGWHRRDGWRGDHHWRGHDDDR